MRRKHVTIGDKLDDETRVLRKMPYALDARDDYSGKANSAVYVDIETTGLEVDEGDEITSISWVRFEFTEEQPFKILRVTDAGTMLNEPSFEPDAENVMITGLTMDMLRGHKITSEDYDSIFDGAEIAIAHRARFDRRFIDKFYKPLIWGCSLEDIDWYGEYTLPSFSLPVMLAYLRNEYFDHHNSEADAWAGLLMLDYTNDFNPFDQLIKRAFSQSYHLIAVKSPFSAKDFLKGLKMRWCPEGKYWHLKDLSQTEMVELRDEILGYLGNDCDLIINPQSPYERYL